MKRAGSARTWNIRRKIKQGIALSPATRLFESLNLREAHTGWLREEQDNHGR